MTQAYDYGRALRYVQAAADGTTARSRLAGTLLDWMDDYGRFLGFDVETITDGSFGDRSKLMSYVSSGRMPTEVWTKVRAKLATAAKAAARKRRSQLERNLDQIVEVLSLDDIERELVGLLMRAHLMGELHSLLHRMAGGALLSVHQALAQMLDLPAADIRSRLRPGAPLRRHGVLTAGTSAHTYGRAAPSGDPMPQLSNRVVRALDPMNAAPGEVDRALFGDPAATGLTPGDFDHLSRDRDFLLTLLRSALDRGETGINVLLYGPSGTGKTEFCRVLAQALGVPLYAVGEGEDGDELVGKEQRLADLRLTQALVGPKRSALVLFDEMEDLLARRSHLAFGSAEAAPTEFKAQINRLLESSPVPTFWTCNAIHQFDPSLLSRMTYAVEVRIPTAAVRTRLWARESARLGIDLSPDDCRTLARDFEAPPRLAAGALKAANLVKGGSEEVQQTVAGLSKALRGGLEEEPKYALRGPRFDTRLLNVSADLEGLADRLVDLKDLPAVSILLHGPPGTGKSAYGRYLAERMMLDVMERTGANLLSKWVGETEQNIAATFTEAAHNRSLLVLDEIDGLLTDRSGAAHDWQVTKVNEMLVRLEAHPLPLVATTNRLDGLDPAALRRFTFKVKFDYLNREQIAEAFRLFFDAEAPESVLKLDLLTPGDFAIVARNAKLLGETAPAAVAQALAAEVAHKPGHSRPIGF